MGINQLENAITSSLRHWENWLLYLCNGGHPEAGQSLEELPVAEGVWQPPEGGINLSRLVFSQTSRHLPGYWATYRIRAFNHKEKNPGTVTQARLTDSHVTLDQ